MGNLFSSNKVDTHSSLTSQRSTGYLVIEENPVEHKHRLLFYPDLSVYGLDFIISSNNNYNISLSFNLSYKYYYIIFEHKKDNIPFKREQLSIIGKNNSDTNLDYVRSICGYVTIVFKFMDSYYCYDVRNKKLEKIDGDNDVIKLMNIHKILDLKRSTVTHSYNVHISTVRSDAILCEDNVKFVYKILGKKI
jgi:hypothetical protein